MTSKRQIQEEGERNQKEEDRLKLTIGIIDGLMNDISKVNDPLTKEGKTLLMDTVWQKREMKSKIDKLKILIAFGAEINQLNNSEQTAFDTAVFVRSHSDDDDRETQEKVLKLLDDVGGMPGHRWIKQRAAEAKEREDRIQGHKITAGDRVLCLDNSSTMALVQLELLNQIELATGKKITEHFDWIVASGIGGLLVLLMVYGGKTMSELRHCYFKIHKRVFTSQSVQSRPMDELGVIIDECGLQESIKMSNVKKPKLLIGAVNKKTSTLSLKFFSNCLAIDSGNDPVYKVAQYTCSSLMFFGECDGYIDMALLSKNPCEVGLSRIRKYFQDNPKEAEGGSVTSVVSLGDGIPKSQQLGGMGNPLMHYLTSSGDPMASSNTFQELVRSIITLYSAVGTCQAEAVSAACFSEQCALNKINFIRLNPPLGVEIPIPELVNIETLVDVVIQTIIYVATQSGKQELQAIKDTF